MDFSKKITLFCYIIQWQETKMFKKGMMVNQKNTINGWLAINKKVYEFQIFQSLTLGKNIIIVMIVGQYNNESKTNAITNSKTACITQQYIVVGIFYFIYF